MAQAQTFPRSIEFPTLQYVCKINQLLAANDNRLPRTNLVESDPTT